jgi:hypothetical protein
MHSPADLENAYEAIAGEIHCDLQVSGQPVIDGQRFDSCVAWYEHVTTWKPKRTGSYSSIDDTRRQADHRLWAGEFIAKNFVTVPVARGDLLILVRVCGWCFGAFLKQNSVDFAKCVVEELYSDGFGSPPWKVIDGAGQKSTDDIPPEAIYESDLDDDESDWDEDDYG